MGKITILFLKNVLSPKENWLPRGKKSEFIIPACLLYLFFYKNHTI